MMEDLPRRELSEPLRAHLPLDGGSILDVGCGEGGLVRFLTREGAQAVGLEPSEGQVARARAAEPEGGEVYLRGLAEALPFPDGSFDAVVFANSLHHVPVALQGPALAEAGRVLKPGGLLYALEPVAEGPHFELMLPVEDETGVRAAAWEALKAASQGPHLAAEDEFCFVATVKYRDFAAFRARLTGVDPGRSDAFENNEAVLRELFARLAVQRDGARFLDQPYRLTLLKRPD